MVQAYLALTLITIGDLLAWDLALSIQVYTLKLYHSTRVVTLHVSH